MNAQNNEGQTNKLISSVGRETLLGKKNQFKIELVFRQHFSPHP